MEKHLILAAASIILFCGCEDNSRPPMDTLPQAELYTTTITELYTGTTVPYVPGSAEDTLPEAYSSGLFEMPEMPEMPELTMFSYETDPFGDEFYKLFEDVGISSVSAYPDELQTTPSVEYSDVANAKELVTVQTEQVTLTEATEVISAPDSIIVAETPAFDNAAYTYDIDEYMPDEINTYSYVMPDLNSAF